MTHSKTAAGTPVVEIAVEEYQEFLNAEARSRVGMSLAACNGWAAAIPHLSLA
jgi:hypothetical protein